MKLLNFIRSVPHQKQHAILRWYTISCGALIIATCIIAYLQAQQLYTLWVQREKTKNARAQCVAITPLHTELKTLKEQEAHVHEKLMLVKKIKDAYEQTGDHIKSILQTLAHTAAVQEYQLDNQQTSISLLCQSTQDVLHSIEELTKLSWLHGVQMASLQRTEREKYPYLAVVKARMV